ncbi:MAG: alpha/beta hydrolase [Cyclobacteriaceae bacterium]|nr:alpha/beta hydrolase [Cyclobacteriaceae bacterium]
MNFEQRNIQIDDISISYYDEGSPSSPVLLFIHGFPFSKAIWESEIELLKDNFRIIAYDVRGFGQSDAGTLSFSIQQFANDLLLFISALQLDKIILCGHSMGGYIALLAITQDPDRFNGLILCNTQCVEDSAETKIKRADTVLAVQANGLKKYAADSIDKLFSKTALVEYPKAVTFVEEIILNTPLETITHTLQALANRSETCSLLHTITVPVLIIVGADDQLTPIEASQKMQALIPQSDLKILEGVGHITNLEAPEEFLHSLRFFLASLKT